MDISHTTGRLDAGNVMSRKTMELEDSEQSRVRSSSVVCAAASSSRFKETGDTTATSARDNASTTTLSAPEMIGQL